MTSTGWFWFWLVACALIGFELHRIRVMLESIEETFSMWAELHDIVGDYKLKKDIERDRHVTSLMSEATPPPDPHK
jgi:hypothetical protein